MLFSNESPLYQRIEQSIFNNKDIAMKNLEWLQKQMHPYFFITMKEEEEAITTLATTLPSLAKNRRSILADGEKKLILACRNVPGSLYETLHALQEREISYAHIAHSYGPIPGLNHELEIQRFEFDRKSHHEIALAPEPTIPEEITTAISEAMERRYPQFNFNDFKKLLRILWLNNETYVRISPAERVAQILWLYQQSNNRDGIYLDVEETVGPEGGRETRVLFAVGNPPQKDFLLQTMEVFKRLGLGVKRTYCLTISNGIHPYFLGTFYVPTQNAGPVARDSELFDRLRKELFNTLVLETASYTYQHFVSKKVMTGEEASLINAFIAFCHTNLAHNQPRFDLEGVERAFHSHPDIALQLVKLFKIRFNPAQSERTVLYQLHLGETVRILEDYNTGRKTLDEFRRSIFKCCLAFIQNTLKTNFFVLEKHALAFRIDPAYLAELPKEFTADLPSDRPFRITFFFGRYGSAFHIGFSDIARGGWRTIITKDRDDYVTNANTMFRENYVLAHTQHLKNKDIFEGGSKMVAILKAGDLVEKDLIVQRLHKLQYGFINAFLDIFVTVKGQTKDPRVVDYYGEDEPIELGPDENMHDEMIEQIARQAAKRGYLLGVGIMSGKKVGINHKEYGVTSTGVVKFAEITMAELGIDIHREPFSVKITGGPGGDVAGNAMRLLLERCPKVMINLILDGSGVLFDPEGANRKELRRLLLKEDIEAFSPQNLHVGGFILYRNERRKEGLRELYKKVVRNESGLEEQWISVDDFYRTYNGLPFTVSADLFIPAGGRPETIDQDNWSMFFSKEGIPSARAIVEGANSFLTPEARIQIQKQGVIVMRDASANKCGVISSSYEIIANLLMEEDEFISHKERYVADVIEILERRAEEEARLIFKRHREGAAAQLYTEISEAISREINDHYARLFNFFQLHPVICNGPLFNKAILSHLPRFLIENKEYHQRINKLPEKYRYAILAGEIASSLVYRGNREAEFEEMLKGHLTRTFPAQQPAA